MVRQDFFQRIIKYKSKTKNQIQIRIYQKPQT